MSIINRLNGIKFDWVDGGGTRYGFIAQDVEDVIPTIVGFNGTYKTVDYSGVVPFLVEAVKLQQQQITELTTRIAVLEAK